MKIVTQKISNVCRHTDCILWDAYEQSKDSQRALGTGHLDFTWTRKGELRVSEQEARFAFVEALCQEGLRYSTEVPTTELYNFSGKSGNDQSALTDVQARDESAKVICNVEFKAKGISMRAKTKKDIYKDIEKLMREPEWGGWFHLLKNVNRSTIPNILFVIAEQIGKVKRHGKEIKATGLTIHVCVLREKFSIQKNVPFSLDDTKLAEHLHVDYRVSRGKLKEVSDLNGWCLTEGGRNHISK